MALGLRVCVFMPEMLSFEGKPVEENDTQHSKLDEEILRDQVGDGVLVENLLET